MCEGLNEKSAVLILLSIALIGFMFLSIITGDAGFIIFSSFLFMIILILYKKNNEKSSFSKYLNKHLDIEELNEILEDKKRELIHKIFEAERYKETIINDTSLLLELSSNETINESSKITKDAQKSLLEIAEEKIQNIAYSIIQEYKLLLKSLPVFCDIPEDEIHYNLISSLVSKYATFNDKIIYINTGSWDGRNIFGILEEIELRFKESQILEFKRIDEYIMEEDRPILIYRKKTDIDRWVRDQKYLFQEIAI